MEATMDVNHYGRVKGLPLSEPDVASGLDGKPLLRLTGHQLRDALDIAWPDRAAGDNDQGETMLVFYQLGLNRVVGGINYQAGVYCYFEDLPEEGSVHLPTDSPADVAKAGAPSGLAQFQVWYASQIDPDATFERKCDVYRDTGVERAWRAYVAGGEHAPPSRAHVRAVRPRVTERDLIAAIPVLPMPGASSYPAFTCEQVNAVAVEAMRKLVRRCGARVLPDTIKK